MLFAPAALPPYTAPPMTAANAQACSLARIDRCPDTNRLVDKPDFVRSVRAFVGPGHASWFYRNGSAAKQVLEGLHGPPDTPVEVAPSLLRFSACRAHSCPEKAAAFIGRDGRLRAIAVLDFRCGDSKCEDDYSLEVIAPAADAARFTELAHAWADPSAADERKAAAGYNGHPPVIVRTTFRAAAGR